MLTVFKPVVEKPLKPIATLLRNVNPNLISMLGLIFPTIFFILVLRHDYAWALFVFIFNAVDMLDGMVARMTGKVTTFGGFLDSTIDRYADFAALSALSFAGIVSWDIVAPLILFSYLISYMRTRIEYMAKGKVTASVGIMERTERLVGIFIALLLFALWPHVILYSHNLAAIVFILLTVLSGITVIQRFVFAYQKL